MADEKNDVAPDLDDTGMFSTGWNNNPAWGATQRGNASIIPTDQTTSTNRNLTIYDLIEFGPAGKIPTDSHGLYSRDGSGWNSHDYLKEKFKNPENGTPSTFPSECGKKWLDIPAIRGDLTFGSKAVLARALLDFVGCVAWEWQQSKGLHVAQKRLRDLSLEDVLNLAWHTNYWNTNYHVWFPRGSVGYKFNFGRYNLTGDAQGETDKRIVTEDDLPFGGRYFRMGTKEFVKETGISIDALTQGMYTNKGRGPTSTQADDLDGVHVLADYTKGWTPVSRSKIRHARLKYVTAKDILAYNYFYLNEEEAQAAFDPANQRKKLEDQIEATKDEKEKAELLDQYDALLRKQRADCVNTGNAAPWDVENANLDNLIFSEKCILASNLKILAQMNTARAIRTKKYEKVELCTGSPTDFINKLYMQKGFLEFAHQTTNLQLSTLLPIYRFYKIEYDEKGCPAKQIEISFPQRTDFTAMLKSHGRGQVGVRNIEWSYISDNPSTVRNDITATVTLFFQNFNALVEPRTNKSGDTWNYLNLLRRPPKDLQKIVKAQQNARSRTNPQTGNKNGCPSKETDVAVATSQTTTSAANPADDDISSATNEQEVDINPRSADAKFYEIKMVVGWAPPKKIVAGENKPLMREGIKNNATPLFLTLIDHEFDIGQDGVFELTLTYRARIEGLLSDGRANVLATNYNRQAREELDNRMTMAKLKCDEDEIENIKTQIEGQKRVQKAWLADTLLSDLLQGAGDFNNKTQVFTALLTPQDLVDAQYHTEDIPLTFSNTNVIGPGPIDGLQALAGEATQAALSDIFKDTYNYIVARGAKLEGDLLSAQVATKDASSLSKEERDARFKDDIDRSTTGQLVDLQEPLEDMVWTTTNFGGTALLAYHLGMTGGWTKEQILNIEKIVEDQKKRSTDEKAAIEKSGYPMHFMFAGDLINSAAVHALSYMGTDLSTSQVGFAPCTTENIKVVLGPVSLQDKKGQTYTINIADIPISLNSFKDWFKRNITDQDRTSYSLIKFIRDLIQEAVVDVLNADCFQGTIQQKINLKTGIVSIPMKSNGASPIDERIKEGGFVPDGLTSNRQSAMGGGLTGWRFDETVLANTLPIQDLTPTSPLYQGNVWSKAGEMFHYLYVYGETQEPASDLNGDFTKDVSRGIYHLYMGAEKGLVKSIKFSKTDQPFLREARFERDALNPLAELSAVYKADVTLVGNTMFYPGQYVFINMQPIGQDLGHPGDKKANDGYGSYANQLGLGGYHIITKVQNEITSDNQFETTLTCLWDNSGDGRSRLSAGSQTTVDSCGEDKTSIGDTTIPGTENMPGGSTIEQP